MSSQRGPRVFDIRRLHQPRACGSTCERRVHRHNVRRPNASAPGRARRDAMLSGSGGQPCSGGYWREYCPGAGSARLPNFWRCRHLRPWGLLPSPLVVGEARGDRLASRASGRHSGHTRTDTRVAVVEAEVELVLLLLVEHCIQLFLHVQIIQNGFN